MKITCISDLHGYYPELAGGDLLIVAGDLTASDEYEQYEYFFKWMQKQSYSKKIFISGNHDNQSMSQFDWEAAEYLSDSGCEFQGLKIWGSPWTAAFPGMNPKCMAFTLPFGCDEEEHLNDKWDLIPDDIDILVTHGPPYGIYDAVRRYPQDVPQSTGSISLRNQVISRIKPKLHIFGHIHEHGGKIGDMVMIKFINCSYVNERYAPVNKPITIDL